MVTFGRVAESLIYASIVCVLVIMSGLPGWCGCTQCGSMQGIDVNERDGTVAVLPVVAGVDVGQGAPGRCDASNLPGNGNVRNLGTANSPNIKWGTSRITLDGSGNVLMDGVRVAGWSWTSGTRTLTAAQGYVYVFDNTTGMLTSASGSDGLFVTTFTYSSSFLTPAPIFVVDSLGNVWLYGSDSTKPGPSEIINPDQTKEVVYTYKAVGTNGAGQYDVITVNKKLSGYDWTEQEHTSYSYNSDNKLTQVSTVDVDDEQNPSTTNIEYVSGSEGGRTNPVRRIYNTKLNVDICYEYGTESIAETYEGSKTYGYTEVRRRATCSSASSYSANNNDNSADQVSRIYYYQNGDSKLDYMYKIAWMVSDGNGGLQAYSTVKYQVYGYLTRFSASPPTYYDILRGKNWKIVDARGNTTTYTYSTTNALVTQITLPTTNYIQYWYKQIGGTDSTYVEKVRDSRGKHTKYTRDSSYPSLVTTVEVSDYENSGYSTVQEMSYYSTPSQKQGMLYQVTVPDIEGNDDMVTTYDYSETIGGTTYYRDNPTTETYSWWNGSSYENKSATTSYYKDGRLRWGKDALNNGTDYTYNTDCNPIDTWFPADSADSGTVDSSTSTTMTDSSQSWYEDQLAGMALQITSGTYSGNTYPITSNTATVITISGTLPSVSGQTYVVRPYDELHYLACCGLVDEERDGGGKKTYYEHDDAGHVTEVRNDVTGENSTDPLVEYIYNDLGQKTAVKTYTEDSSTARETTYVYDQLGRIIQMIYPTGDGGTRLLWDEYYQYDVNGNVIAKLVGTVSGGSITAGSVTAYEYDSLNRLTEVKYSYAGVNDAWPIASISISNEDVSYQYDGGSGLKTQMVDASGTSSYTYDKQGLLVTYTPPLPANYRVDYSYNAAGDKTSVVVKYNNGGWVNKYQTAYAYFKNGWLKQVKGQKWNSGTSQWDDMTQVDYEYDAAGNRTKRKNNGSNDVESTYAHNARSETKSITHNKTTDLYKLEYIRDGLGDPLQVAFSGSQFAQPYSGADKVRYEYDNTSRLTNQDWGYGNWTSVDSTSWSYDWVGNRDPSSNDYWPVPICTDTLLSSFWYGCGLELGW